MEEERNKKTRFSRILLTCSNCGHFPLVIDNISEFTYSKEYSIITKCPKCKSVTFKHVPKEVFDKLDLDNL